MLNPLSIYAITEKLFEKKKNESIKEKRDCIEVTEKTDSDKTDQTKHFIIKR